MSKFHSIVSRRDFMKGLGLGAAGLGAAVATTPAFHDLDEVMAATEAARKMPWWVKDRDVNNPTVEIDWSLKERYDKRNFENPDDEESERRVQVQCDFIKERWNDPGMTHKDYAFMAGCGTITSSNPLNRPVQNLHYTNGGTTQPGGYTYQDLGLPRWSASPEENLRMVTAALHFWGAGQVGVYEIDEKSKKSFYLCDNRGRTYDWDNVDEAYSDADHACVIPSSAKYVLTWVVPQSGSGIYILPDGTNIMGKTTMNIGYSHAAILRIRIGLMIGALGYKSISNSCGGNNVGCGVLAGNGELGRTDYMVSPEYGTMVRMSDFMLTDLPLAITKPIDAGIFRFCHTCKKCSENCPAGAMPLETEPTFEITNPGSNGYGLNSYHIDYVKCHPFRGSPGGMRPGGCGICQNVCVFNKQATSSIHEIVKGVVANTGIFNSFFKTMDDAFGFGEYRDPVEFWDELVNTQGSFVPWPWVKSNVSGGSY